MMNIEQYGQQAMFVSFSYAEKTADDERQVSDLIDFLLNEMELKKSEKRRICLCNYLSSLVLVNSELNFSNKVIFPQGSDYFSEKGLFARHYPNFSGYAVKINNDIVDALKKLHYVSVYKGETGKKTAATVSANDKLLRLFDDYEVDILSFDKRLDRKDFVVIRDPKGELDKGILKTEQTEMLAFNKLLSAHQITLAELAISDTHKHYQRIFQGDFSQQGQFVSSLSHLDLSELDALSIDGEPVVQLTMRAAELFVRYAQAQQDITLLSEHPYEIHLEGEDISIELTQQLYRHYCQTKDLVKSANLMMLDKTLYPEFDNLNSSEATSKTIKILSRLLDKHRKVQENQDSIAQTDFAISQVQSQVLSACVASDCAVIIIKDGFIVPEANVDQLAEQFVNAIIEQTGLQFANPERLLALVG